MKNKLILTDADGVLVNWNDSFSKFMRKRGHYVVSDSDGHYNLGKRYGISTKLAMDLVKEFNESDHIKELHPLSDSTTYIPRLVDLGFRFVVITSLSDSPIAKKNRIYNLTSVFGDIFDDFICLPVGSAKLNTLLTWADTGYFWIEDHLTHAESGYEVGLNSVLINHPYNYHYQTDLFPKVSVEHAWAEIFDLVCKDYNISIDNKISQL